MFHLPGIFGTEFRSCVVAFSRNFRANGRLATKCHKKKESSAAGCSILHFIALHTRDLQRIFRV